MWFLFYLEITGQMTQKYKICSFCSEPIFPEEGKEKVHGKRKFHEGCRQKHNEFAKNRAISMHKEGKNITEIINEFPDIKKETIFRWISANKGWINLKPHNHITPPLPANGRWLPGSPAGPVTKSCPSCACGNLPGSCGFALSGSLLFIWISCRKQKQEKIPW